MYNIALDGPSGAGKSTIAKMLSDKLGILYLDTGALYRAIGLKAYLNNWEADDAFVAPLMDSTDITVKYDRETGSQVVFLDGKDVSTDIRQHFVSDFGSRFSALPSVRAKLLGTQRSIAAQYDSVLDGRDIGTCVLPDAKYKFYLTASVEERALRRYKQLTEKGGAVPDIKQIQDDIQQRDYRDMNREIAPLKQADDAILIDSTIMTAEEVVSRILSYIKE